MQSRQEDNKLTIFLTGRVDSSNAAQTEEDIRSTLEGHAGEDLVLDVGDLEYISSAGLRVLMRLLRERGSLSVVNASLDVYDIFDMTGFTQIMDVQRALRRVSVEGLPMIGAGANGQVYRLDEERIVKVYNPLTNTPQKIAREKDAARAAFASDALKEELVRRIDAEF